MTNKFIIRHPTPWSSTTSTCPFLMSYSRHPFNNYHRFHLKCRTKLTINDPSMSYQELIINNIPEVMYSFEGTYVWIAAHPRANILCIHGTRPWSVFNAFCRHALIVYGAICFVMSNKWISTGDVDNWVKWFEFHNLVKQNFAKK